MPGPHRPLISTAQLTALVAVAECGGVSRAALELQLAQSTVSGLIRSLEALLGAPLLRRDRRGCQLTPLGERVCAHARQALGALEAMREEVAPAPARLGGRLCIIACRSAARHLVLPSLGLLRGLHPQIEVVLSDTGGEHEEVREALLAGRAEVGFGRLPMPGLLGRPLISDEFLVVRRRGAPAPRGWAELQAQPLLLADQDCAPYILAHCARHGARLAVTRALRDPQVILDMVRAGAGLTILSGLVLHPLPPDLETSPLPAPLWRDLGWAVRPDHVPSPLLSAYLDLLGQPAALREATAPVRQLLRYAGG